MHTSWKTAVEQRDPVINLNNISALFSTEWKARPGFTQTPSRRCQLATFVRL